MDDIEARWKCLEMTERLGLRTLDEMLATAEKLTQFVVFGTILYDKASKPDEAKQSASAAPDSV